VKDYPLWLWPGFRYFAFFEEEASMLKMHKNIGFCSSKPIAEAVMWGATVCLVVVLPLAFPQHRSIAFLVGSACTLLVLRYVCWLSLSWQASFNLEEQPNTRRQRDQMAGVIRCRWSASDNYIFLIAELRRLNFEYQAALRRLNFEYQAALRRLNFEYEHRMTSVQLVVSAAPSIQCIERIGVS
jgi:hypothetical protein